MIDEPDDEQDTPTLCDACAERMTNEANWLGVLAGETFTCLVCLALFCAHLKTEGGICQKCMEATPRAL